MEPQVNSWACTVLPAALIGSVCLIAGGYLCKRAWRKLQESLERVAELTDEV